MKNYFLIIFLFTTNFYCECNSPINPELHYKYVESFFTFQGSFGNRFSLSDKYIKEFNCGISIYDFDSTINLYEFYNDCSQNIIDSYHKYVDYKVEVNKNLNQDSVRKEILEKVKACDKFKQCFYSIYCQYYQIDTNRLFGVEILKKDTLTLDSLENIALHSFTIDAVDSVERFLMSHFCRAYDSLNIQDVSKEMIFHDIANVIHTEKVTEVWRVKIGLLNAETRARKIDGDNLEDIRKKVEYKLRKDIKESGLLGIAIMESYLKSNYKPYVIR